MIFTYFLKAVTILLLSYLTLYKELIGTKEKKKIMLNIVLFLFGLTISGLDIYISVMNDKQLEDMKDLTRSEIRSAKDTIVNKVKESEQNMTDKIPNNNFDKKKFESYRILRNKLSDYQREGESLRDSFINGNQDLLKSLSAKAIKWDLNVSKFIEQNIDKAYAKQYNDLEYVKYSFSDDNNANWSIDDWLRYIDKKIENIGRIINDHKN